MNEQFINETIKINELPKDCIYNRFFLANNEKQIEKMCSFLKSDLNIFLISGFKGSGKSLLCNFISDFINPQVYVINYRCFETTILDDLLLSFFDSFHKFVLQNRFQAPKIKAENFTQKIDSYFNSINAPILIVIKDFDEILKPNKKEILSFISHICNFSNVKILITSKTFNYSEFEGAKYDTMSVMPLTQEYFEKYLKSSGIKQIGVLSTELYKKTKGYFENVFLSVKIIGLRKYSLGQFLELYSKSLMNFSEFIVREALSLVDPVSMHLFRLLAMMKIPIGTNLLNSLHLYNPERINFFIENGILSQDDKNCIYLDENFRAVTEQQIPDNIASKLHSSCIDLYNTQLPLKPTERDLLLSRQTMRNEIEYHSLFIPKKIYRKKEEKIPDNANLINEKADNNPNPVSETQKTKEEKYKQINFIIEDETVLDNIASSIKDFVKQNEQKKEFVNENSGLGLTKLLNLAKQQESQFNFKQAIMLYQTALTKKDDDGFYNFLPKIYIKLAQNYKKLSSWYESLEYYTQAQDYYYNAGNPDKVNEIKFEIANIYYTIYKTDNAKVILNNLQNDKTISSELKIKVYLLLGKISENNSDSLKFYQKAILDINESEVSKDILSELYYKYAALCDETDNIKQAAIYYKKCIEIDENPKTNHYLSRSLSAIAQLYYESGNNNLYEKYFSQSIKIDTELNNFEGLYYSYMRLYDISEIDDEKFEYLKKACNCAQKLNEPYYIEESNTELGKYYYGNNEFDLAYNCFITAKKYSKNPIIINSKISEINQKLGSDLFKKLEDKYGK